MFGNADKMFPIFFGTWIVLGILSFYLFFIRNDYEFKVKYQYCPVKIERPEEALARVI
jgi:hypothetical protein